MASTNNIRASEENIKNFLCKKKDPLLNLRTRRPTLSCFVVLLRPEKKVLVVCLAGCAVVLVFGSGNYDRKKKSSSRLSGGLCCCVSFWFWRLPPEKKVLVVCLGGCAM
jgi:hypothetical protein